MQKARDAQNSYRSDTDCVWTGIEILQWVLGSWLEYYADTTKAKAKYCTIK